MASRAYKFHTFFEIAKTQERTNLSNITSLNTCETCKLACFGGDNATCNPRERASPGPLKPSRRAGTQEKTIKKQGEIETLFLTSVCRAYNLKPDYFSNMMLEKEMRQKTLAGRFIRAALIVLPSDGNNRALPTSLKQARKVVLNAYPSLVLFNLKMASEPPCLGQWPSLFLRRHTVARQSRLAPLHH